MYETLTIILFIVLILIMLVVGYLSGRKKNSEEDFQIYGRNLSKPAFIASYFATFIGAGFFLVGSAYSYQFGIGMLWYPVGLILGIITFGFYSAWLKKETKDKKYYNLPDFFSDVFSKSTGKIVAILVSILIAGDLSIQLISGGKILDILGIANYNVAVVITVVVIAIYLLSSGFRAVVWTDFVLAILIGVLTLIISYTSISSIPIITLDFDFVPIGTIIGFFLFGLLGPFSISTYYQRIFAAKDEQTAKHGTWMSGIFVFILVILLIIIGMASKSIFPSIDPDLALLSLLTYFGGLIFALGALVLWSALMSSADTLTFSGSQILTRDIFGRTINKENTRMSILALLVVGVLLSFLIPSIVSTSILFLGGGMIIAPIAFFNWFLKFSHKTANTALILGLVALIATIIFMGISPTIIAIVFLVTGLTVVIGSVIENIIFLEKN